MKHNKAHHQDSTQLIKHDPDFSHINGKPVKTINPPLYTGSTVLFENYHDLAQANQGQYEGLYYGTDRLPTQRALEQALEQLEQAALTRVFQSGINAIQHALLAFTQAGDHILVCDNVYGPTASFCRKILSRYQIETTFIRPDSGADIARYIRPNTRVIFLESPGSNTFEIQDIPAITQLARQKGIITLLDNTWATPLYLKPFKLGVDVSIQSITKYLSGHSDLLMGSVSVTPALADTFRQYYTTMELYASPQDCYLALRGLKTLAVRLAQHQQSALKIAQWLEAQPSIERVIHPALPSHPQHHLWKRDFNGASGLFAFIFKPSYQEPQIARFVDALQLFDTGYSWGGFKSLITAGKYRRQLDSDYTDRMIIRLNIGLEDAQDLMADLEEALGHLQID